MGSRRSLLCVSSRIKHLAMVFSLWLWPLLICCQPTAKSDSVISDGKKTLILKTSPQGAEIYLDGKFLGLSPAIFQIQPGTHKIRLVLEGFANEEHLAINEAAGSNQEEKHFLLKKLFPLTIRSEKRNLLIEVRGLGDLANVLADSGAFTPGQLLLPHGQYQITLSNNHRVHYRGRLAHKADRKPVVRLPSYSMMSYRLASIAYDGAGIGEISLGQVEILPWSGITTSILNIQYHEFDIKMHDGFFYQAKALMPSVLLLNLDWRMGGSVIRQLDINALGQFRWVPGLKTFSKHIDGYDDVSLFNYFLGAEVSTRLPYFNIFARAGHQVYDGDVNFWDPVTKKYVEDKNFISVNKLLMVGISLHGPVRSSNHLLRIWKKPLLNQFRDLF